MLVLQTLKLCLYDEVPKDLPFVQPNKDIKQCCFCIIICGLAGITIEQAISSRVGNYLFREFFSYKSSCLDFSAAFCRFERQLCILTNLRCLSEFSLLFFLRPYNDMAIAYSNIKHQLWHLIWLILLTRLEFRSEFKHIYLCRTLTWNKNDSRCMKKMA